MHRAAELPHLLLAALALAVAGPAQTPEDRAFIQRMTAERGAKGAAGQNPQRAAQMAAWVKTHPPRDSTGMIPLNDLGKRTYKGEPGGLYPGGVNTPPPAHLKAGLKIAASIVPIDGAQPGQAADQAADPQSNYWKVVDTRMNTAGVTNAQVQALWIKAAYPLYDSNLAYLSSRIHAGYSASPAGRS